MTLAVRGTALLVALLALAAGSDRGQAADIVPHERFEHITTDDGLSRSFVLAILKDSQGFLWFGTQDGLNRYDGRSLTVYLNDPKDPESLPSSLAGVLYEDSKKRLWVGSSWAAEGLALYDRARDRFKRFRPAPGHGGSEVGAIIEDRQGQLWVGTDEGVARFDPEAGTFKVFPLPFADPTAPIAVPVRSLLEDRRGVLWVGTTAGLLTFDRASGRYARWNTGSEDPVGLNHGGIYDLLEDEEGMLWVPTLGGGLFRIDPATGRETHYRSDPSNSQGLGHPRVRKLASDGQGHIYVGTENGGLDVLDRASGRFTHFRADIEDETSLNSDSIWALRMDDQGILWIGTAKGGVNVLSPLSQRFELLRARRGGLTDPHVGSVLEDSRGDLWIGTDGGGIDRLDRRSGRFTHYRHDPKNPATIATNSILAMLEDPRGKLWVGGWAAGLARLDPASGRAIRYRHDERDPSSIVSDNVWSVTALRTGELLVATHGGVDVVDPRTGRFSRLSARFPGAGRAITNFAFEDREGDLWILTLDSVEHVEHSTGKVTIHTNDPKDPTSRPPGMVHIAYVDSLGNTWIGTQGGLWLIARGGDRRRRYTTADGLPHDNVNNILEDNSGNLWLSSNRGLVCMLDAVHPAEKPKFQYFDVHDGLQGQEFTERTAFKSRSGEMFFGGPRGLNIFRPDAIRLNLLPPRVVFTDLRILNKSAGMGAPGSPLTMAITQTEALTLSYRHSMVTFEFAALNFLLPQKNQYAYKLEGFDSAWNYVGTQRTATYTSLPPGRYALRVKAANNDGVWNEAGTRLALTVLPPFYRALWFRLLVLLTIAAGLAFAYRRRTARMHLHAKELAAKVDERTRDLNHVNEKLASLNQQLEDRVQARTVELEAEKERLAVTLRSIGDGVIATDVEGRIVLVNRVAEQITGWRPAEAYDRTLREIMPLVDRRTREPLPDPVSTALERGAVLDLPTTAVLVRRDGSEVLIADSAAPIRDRESRIVGVVLVFRDVTERRKIEEELQNAQKLESLGVLAGGIAHDFNNLLTGIFGLVDLARNRSPADAPARGSLERALAVLDRARGLTGQLLTFSQHGHPVTGPVALGPLLRDCVEFALSGSNVSCKLEVAGDIWLCDGDERQIDQVVDNLLLNARQAMPRGGTVHVQAVNVMVPEDVQVPVAPGRYVRIAVRDHGEGVPPELRSRIFEPFFTTKSTGSGLGLATSYSIIRKHGGHIELSSEPGEGAAFVVYLPASSRAPASPSKRESRIPEGRGRVLIVDDEDYVREVANELLEELGYTVETAADGDAALKACRRAVAEGRPFDVAILDLTIPGGLGGIATAPLLCRVDPRLPLIASSGYSGDPVMANPRAYGFVATLSKPFTLEELGTLVARVLNPAESFAAGGAPEQTIGD